MSSILFLVVAALGVLLLYGVGVFLMCLHDGDNRLSAVIQASAWGVAFSISHFFSYLALTLR
jgi:hypothetical protein